MATDSMLQIRVNGEERWIIAGFNVASMLDALGVDPTKVAVERNHEIVPRSTLTETPVENGDTFEVVHFVGGG
jgi:thiamine biosynthesis protein ThiS